MSRKWKLTLPLCISAICVVLLGMTISAQGPESRDTGNVVVITGVQAGINTCAYQAVSIYIRTDEPLYLAVTIIYDGQIVTDNVTSASYPDGIFTFAGLGYDNARGRAPVNLWPLTPGKKVKWFLTLFTADWEPVYEARSVANSCDATTLSSTTHGPAYQLMENHSFEAQGQVGGVLNPEAAMFWKRLNAANDSRVCSTPTPRGGSSNYVGECGFLFIADAGVKTKVKQKYTGTIGQSGDIVYLNGFAQSFTGYSGGGKFKAILTLANGTTHTMVRAFPTGLSLYGTFPNAYPYDAFFVLPAPLVSATVVIEQKYGTGNVAVDAVTLSVFTNSNTALRALPIPPAPGAAINVLGGV